MRDDGILNFYQRNGGGLKSNAHDFSEEVLALIGKTVTELLSKSELVTPEHLIQALYSLGEHSVDAHTYPDCMELIEYLLKKMH